MKARERVLPLFIPHLGCPHDCVFCAQRSVTGAAAPVTPEQVREALERLPAPVDEIAFYGGSFTALPPEEQRALLEAAVPAVRGGMAAGLRVSTRPDAIDGDTLSLLAAYPVRTVELGAQSMDDGVLLRCGRGHTAEDTRRAAALVRARGFRLILQMMTGLPGASDETDTATARELISLRPDGVRIYPTVILRDTPLYTLWRAGAYREHTVEDAVRVCAGILPLFDAAGIPVIRLGLNPSEELSAGAAAAGAYHPALGELVRSRLYLEAARRVLAPARGGAAVLGVCPGGVSQMVGQHRENLRRLSEEFHLQSLSVRSCAASPGQVTLLSYAPRAEQAAAE